MANMTLSLLMKPYTDVGAATAFRAGGWGTAQLSGGLWYEAQVGGTRLYRAQEVLHGLSEMLREPGKKALKYYG